MNTLQLPSAKKYTLPQKHLKIRFGATGGFTFSSTSSPSANLLSIPLPFAQTAQASLQVQLTPSAAGPHSALSGLGLHFLPRRRTQKGTHLPCSSHKLDLKSAES